MKSTLMACAIKAQAAWSSPHRSALWHHIDCRLTPTHLEVISCEEAPYPQPFSLRMQGQTEVIYYHAYTKRFKLEHSAGE